MFKFLFSKSFTINLLISIVFAGLLIWGVFKFINSYTLHGQTISVPELEGLTIAETESILSEKKLRFTILDSIYIAEADKGVILEQNPSANDLVKENRTIYITVSKIVPPKVSMPNVVDMSLRLAVAKLESYGLKVKTKHRPSECVNCVLKQEIDGKEVSLNDKIKKGSTILLTIGLGTSDEKVMVPLVKGLTKEEAENKLMGASLNIGFSDYENCKCETKEDTLNAKVYRQNPIRSENVAIKMGSSVDLYFTCDTNMITINPSDTILIPDTLNQQ
jgi:beta-lactam-binding protein with PASTA domain